MTALEVCLTVGLILALVVALVLAVTLPRRVAQLVAAEQARGDTRALVVKAALHEASAAEVAVIVAPLRALLDDHVRRTLAAQENVTVAAAGEVERITASLHELLTWLCAFAHAQHVQAGGVVEVPETTRMQDRAPPASRERPSPAIAPPGSAPSLPPGPGLIAAGLGPRPSSRPAQASAPPRPAPAGAPRTATMIGVAPPAPRTSPPSAAGERRALGSAPTLLSMPAVAQPSTRPVPPVGMERHTDRDGQEGAP